MSTLSNPTVIRPSATLIVVAPTTENTEHGCNYRVLMMKRNAKSSFINAHVFPGGVVDSFDHASHWSNNRDDISLTSKICAIRETFEESGVLLTDPPASAVPQLDASDWRKKVHDDASQFKVMCDMFQLQPATDRLVSFANWVTPLHEKKRYNTEFFLTVLKDKVLPTDADGEETVQLDWFTPDEALTQWRQKQILLFPPQFYCLYLMQQIPDYQLLSSKVGLGTLRTQDGRVISILPQLSPVEEDDPMKKDEYHHCLVYPGDAAYVGSDTYNRPGQKHRIYFRGRMQDFVVDRNVDVSDIIKAKI
ncbi:hypothetical protein EC973_002507 [Apophysomyces ossiformis]|uniref:Nudix hydrolase domain-containing protein n=1 Tax=Apophysomyces ossiformis TaxID=679940 RepID=A0A8H7BTJ6_9FUNG|nr:hypothetical protein EC973_002507 [Apophysomyces ossiformis]